MSDTTDNNNNTDNTDEPTKSELHERVEQLESTVEKLMPSRRDALKLGAAGIAGAAGLSATSQSAVASTGSAGQIGDPSNRPDIFADEIDANNLTGVSAGGDKQGCRVTLSSNQSFPSGSAVKIQFDTEAYDSGNNFDTSTHNWTCPKDGLYAVHLQTSPNASGSGQERSAVIGSATNGFPNNVGAVNNKTSTDSFDKMSVSTVNKYSQGDTIAGYARNKSQSDSLAAGSGSFTTFLEVAFIGGL